MVVKSINYKNVLLQLEAQMCKILTALDTASDKISESTKNAKVNIQFLNILISIFSLNSRLKKSKNQLKKKVYHHHPMKNL